MQPIKPFFWPKSDKEGVAAHDKPVRNLRKDSLGQWPIFALSTLPWAFSAFQKSVVEI
jgi:hypothetical protein